MLIIRSALKGKYKADSSGIATLMRKIWRQFHFMWYMLSASSRIYDPPEMVL